jgi:hypothetical protein
VTPLRTTRVAADVGAGFHAAEARGLQTALVGVLTAVERAAGTAVPVEVRLDATRDAAVVVLCRNQVVGFVPPDPAGLAAGFRAQQAGAGRRARLVAPGLLHRDAATALWRVWVGAEPDDGLPPVPEGLDTLAAPEPSIFGVPLRRGGA